MNGRAFVCLVLLALAPLAPRPAACSTPAVELQPDLRALLPSASDLTGWSPKDAPQVYKGDDLFLYIDGGAEIYREYGFKQVIAQDYQDAKSRSVSLEVYEMADAAAAYGMFTFKSSGKGQAVAVGQDAQLEDYYLNFWKGPYAVTAVGFDESAESRAGILQIARAVAVRLKTTEPRPDLMKIFPREWEAGARVVYFKGPLALSNLSFPAVRELAPFKEGAAVEREGSKILVLAFENAAEAGRKSLAAERAAAQNTAFTAVARMDPANWKAKDSLGRELFLRHLGRRLAFVVLPAGVRSLDEADRIFKALQK
jgi:hypothetical protein